MKPEMLCQRSDLPLRMMITSAGRRVGLLNSFRNSAAELGLPLEILACDCNVAMSSACHEADLRFAVPPASDPSYVEALLDICRTHGVALLVPTIDPELQPLADADQRFAEIGTYVSVSAPALVAIARDKLETARFLAAVDVSAPRSATPQDILDEPEGWAWPLLAKPSHGSSGRAVQRVVDLDAVRHLPTDEDFVVQEFLEGREHTVNLYFDRCGHMRCAIPHERLQIRSGEVEKGITCHVPALEEIAEKLARALPSPRGALCFQAMVRADGSASVFEINARFGGGYPLAHRAGGHFTRWLLEEVSGRTASANNGWQEGVLMLRYDAAFFVTP
ncbi:ATP-grasp domain-containing protein [Sphingomonas sp. C3-2]|uniref:ATP-grasp domain-containing protein n=1 Tax=Sphingomonas sp. C3-2 TaxID=3062169 RepID=UPI00294B3BB9|nr:ATP-grasp domain-containing protein [Sphingomonas sp. C3-2]WOK36516.1 ATP-grasp domain-containing protein [Sphingomonas sp. C3-2]